ILAVLEPRSNTMKLGAMAARLPAALAQADLTFCYAATSGRDALSWDAARALAPLGDAAHTYHDINELVAAVAAVARSGDHVIVMSNGGFAGVHDRILTALKERTATSRMSSA